MAVSQRNRCLSRGRDRLKASAGRLVESQQTGTPHQSELCKGCMWGGGGGSSLKGFPAKMVSVAWAPRSRVGNAVSG